MPIAVEVVTPAQFAAWVASKGGTMPGAVRPTSSDATQNSPITNPSVADVSATAGGSATATSPEPSNVVDAVATPATSSQGATNSRRGDSQ
jgi:cytochrome c oxidase subunit 2